MIWSLTSAGFFYKTTAMVMSVKALPPGLAYASNANTNENIGGGPIKPIPTFSLEQSRLMWHEKFWELFSHQRFQGDGVDMDAFRKVEDEGIGPQPIQLPGRRQIHQRLLPLDTFDAFVETHVDKLFLVLTTHHGESATDYDNTSP